MTSFRFPLFNPFSTNVQPLYPLNTSENLRFSDVFRGYISGTLLFSIAVPNIISELFLRKIHHRPETRTTKLKRISNSEICWKMGRWRRIGWLIFFLKFCTRKYNQKIFLLILVNFIVCVIDSTMLVEDLYMWKLVIKLLKHYIALVFQLAKDAKYNSCILSYLISAMLAVSKAIITLKKIGTNSQFPTVFCWRAKVRAENRLKSLSNIGLPFIERVVPIPILIHWITSFYITHVRFFCAQQFCLPSLT